MAHADMDAFYAAVEQMDDPGLQAGEPVLVGPNSPRGVVLTASYEARQYGVGSAMPVGEATRRCPRSHHCPAALRALPGAFGRRPCASWATSRHAWKPLSLDEAFLDMTGAEAIFGNPREMGRQIKDAVFEATGLHISVGVSATKYVAKVASAHDKPNGLTVVPPDRARAWLAPLPIRKALGCGKEDRAASRGGWLQGHRRHRRDRRSPAPPAVRAVWARVSAIWPVGRIRVRSNVRGPPRASARHARCSADISRREDIERHLRRAADRIARRARSKRYVASGLRVVLKTSRFELLTRQRTLGKPADLRFRVLCCGSAKGYSTNSIIQARFGWSGWPRSTSIGVRGPQTA